MNKLVALLIGLIIQVAAAPVNAADSIRIGAILAVSGPASFLGLPEKNTLEMLAKEANARGGIKGRKIELVIYDSKGDATKAVQIATRLIENDKVSAIIGPSTTGETMAVIPVVERSGIPLVSCAAGIKIIDPVKKYVFKIPANDHVAAEKIFDYMLAKNQKSVALLTVSDGFGSSGREQLQYMAKIKGISVVADETYGPKDTDMTAQLVRIKASMAQAIICWGTNPGPAIVTRNVKQLGITIPLYQSHGVASKKYIELAGAGNAEGVILPVGKQAIFDRLKPGDPQREVLSNYEKSYGKYYGEETSSFGGYAYDAFTLITNAIKLAGSSPEQIRSGLETAKNVVGVSGIFSMTPEDHNGLDLRAFAVVRIVDGAWQPEDDRSSEKPVHYAGRNDNRKSAGNESSQGAQSSGRTKKESLVAKNESEQDTRAPVIEITSPQVKRGVTFTQREAGLTVIGRAVDASGVAVVTVNGQTAELDAEGRFSAQLLVKPGENQITVSAMDIHRNAATERFTVSREAGQVTRPVVTTAPAAPALAGAYHALVIGNNNYRYLDRLKTAEHDAREVDRLLREKFGFQTTVLLNGTRSEIKTALNVLGRKVKKQDNVLIYYAGHGEFDRTADKAYWLPVDAQRDNDTEWIIADDITTSIKRLPARHVLIVSDSCYSGTLSRSSQTNLLKPTEREEFLKKITERPSRTLMASGGNEPVADGGGSGHSIFADSFLKALREMDKPVFAADELFYQHVKSRVAGKSDQIPQYNEIRNSGHEGGDFVFVRQ